MQTDTGSVARLIETIDWTTSPLGPMDQWPTCVLDTFRLILRTRAQVCMFAGPELVALYNDSYAPSIGLRHPGALGRPAQENWPELWDDLEPMLRHVLETGETISARDRPFYIERFGYPEVVSFDISYSSINSASGKPDAVLCIVSETTERVRAQAELKASETRLRTLFAQSSAGFAVMDPEGRYSLVNTHMSQMLGYAEDEFLTLRMQDILHPDDRAQHQAQLNALLEGGGSATRDQRCLRKDGAVIWVTTSIGAVLDRKGAVVQVTAVMIDISDRRRAEAAETRLAAIIASSEDAILSVDLDLQITSWNRGAERLYGYSADEMLGTSVRRLLPADVADDEDATLARICAGQRTEAQQTVRLCKDGRRVEVSLTVSPIVDEHGAIVGLSKIARDITRHKDAERLQRALVSEMKHRVKNILATVQAIARQTFGREHSRSYQVFESRILALARAQDLITRDSRDGANIDAVIDAVLAPYPRRQFEVTGPALLLSSRAAVALSLSVHELATNAAKYGALTTKGGRVRIKWHVEEDTDPHQLALRWEEHGGPPVSPPAQQGFGSILIREVLASELQGNVTLEFPETGVVCDIIAPLTLPCDGPFDHAAHP